MGGDLVDGDPRMRIRVWVDAKLTEELWLDAGNPDWERITDAARDRHQAITDRADRDGLVWLVEMFDPDLPPGEAYVRVGTDQAGMVSPEPLGDGWYGERGYGDG